MTIPTTESQDIPADPSPGPDGTAQPPDESLPEKPWWTRRKLTWTGLAAVAALVIGVCVGLWVSQNAAQNEKLNTLLAQQSADRAAIQAKANADGAAAQAEAKKAAEAKEFLSGLAVLKAQQDATDARARAAAAQAQAQAQARANVNSPPDAIVQPPAVTSPASRIWGWFSPVIIADGVDIAVRSAPSESSASLAHVVGWPNGRPVSAQVAVVCSVPGENVLYYGEDGSLVYRSSNWDYVVSPAAGWVADVYVDTHGAVPPRC